MTDEKPTDEQGPPELPPGGPPRVMPEPPPAPAEPRISIPAETFGKIMNYLGRQPYLQVRDLVREIEQKAAGE